MLKVQGNVREYAFLVGGGEEKLTTWLVRCVYHHDLWYDDWNAPNLVAQCTTYLERWKEVFPQEKTFSWVTFNVPALIVRIDFTVEEGSLFIYEIEDSPAGVGLSCELVPGFRKMIEEWSNFLNKEVWVVKNSSLPTDDKWWARVIEWPTDEAVLSGMPENVVLAPRLILPNEWVARAIWPVMHRESKIYLSKMGLAEKVRVGEVEKKVMEGKEKGWPGVVFKGLSGSRGRRVRILLFEEALQKAREFLGSSYEPSELGVSCLDSLGKLLHEIEHHWGKNVILQRFVWPVRLVVNGQPGFGIYRLFFVFTTLSGTRLGWKFVGGVVNWRRSLRISGADDAILVPISPRL
jgi:hypothetical protein